MPESLAYMLQPVRLTEVVDIGANPIDGEPPYKRMLELGLCRLVGFEPQAEALAALNAKKGSLETYLPYAVGGGDDGTLNVCRAGGMTSLLEPDEHMLGHFPMFPQWGAVINRLPMATRRLDDLAEVEVIDLLKIDAQGSELSVFKGGHSRLAKAVAVQTEVSFMPLYKQQPIFGEIDLELRRLGFVPHAFAAINKRMIAPMAGNTPFAAFNQLLEADMIYVRDFTQPTRMDVEQLKHLAMIAHYCYRSVDLAANCIFHLTSREAVANDVLSRYLEWIKSEANAGARKQ